MLCFLRQSCYLLSYNSISFSVHKDCSTLFPPNRPWGYFSRIFISFIIKLPPPSNQFVCYNLYTRHHDTLVMDKAISVLSEVRKFIKVSIICLVAVYVTYLWFLLVGFQFRKLYIYLCMEREYTTICSTCLLHVLQFFTFTLVFWYKV